MNNSTLTLYRGDYEKIRRFDVTKTNKHCLVGPGIYMTTDMRIAQTYRTKDERGVRNQRELLFSGAAKDRPDAFDKAYKVWLDDEFDQRLSEGTVRRNDRNQWCKTNAAKLRPLYNEAVREGHIVAEYHTSPWSTRRTLEVRRVLGKPVGHLTKFVFPHDELMTRSLDLTNLRRLEQQLEGTGVALPKSSVDFSTTVAWHKLSVLKQAGFLAIHHDGGVTSGGRRHGVFCVWDHDYVNTYRVARTPFASFYG